MSDASEVIICRTTPWYSKRRLLMSAMLIGFGSYFFYDWKVGYPAAAVKYQEYWPVYEAAEKAGDIKPYAQQAAAKGWPEKPAKKNWDYKIKEQFYWGLGTTLAGVGMLGAFLVNRKKTLTADTASFTTPGGVRVPFSAAVKVDKRKWDNKGLAYVYWKDGDKERKAVIDDLVFDRAVRVLDRLLENFRGELIELEKEEKPTEENPETAPAANSESPPPA